MTIMGNEPLAYDEHWKNSVDRTSPEWIAYCEGVYYVRRYLRTKLREGKYEAIAEFDETCAVYQKTTGGDVRVAGLRDVFRKVWESDRAELQRQVLQEEAYAHAA